MTTLSALCLLGYCRRSTDEQPTSLDVQAAGIGAFAVAGGHELLDVVGRDDLGCDRAGGATEALTVVGSAGRW